MKQGQEVTQFKPPTEGEVTQDLSPPGSVGYKGSTITRIQEVAQITSPKRGGYTVSHFERMILEQHICVAYVLHIQNDKFDSSFNPYSLIVT